jgi:uncharacterized membrane protein
LPSEKLVLDRATPSDVALRASTVGYLAFLAFAWGGNYAWTKLALADSGPWAFNALRYLCASIVLGAILLARGREFSVLPLRGERLPLAVIGLLQIAIMTGASTLALTMIEASRTVLIAYSMPIWGMLLSIAILRERVTARVFAGVVLGFAGLAFLCAPWSMDWTSPAALLGSTLALGGTPRLGARLGALSPAQLAVRFLVADLRPIPRGDSRHGSGRAAVRGPGREVDRDLRRRAGVERARGHHRRLLLLGARARPHVSGAGKSVPFAVAGLRRAFERRRARRAANARPSRQRRAHHRGGGAFEHPPRLRRAHFDRPFTMRGPKFSGGSARVMQSVASSCLTRLSRGSG